MITLLTKIYKNISQQLYNDVINNIELINLQCPHCHAHQLVKHCYYSRHYKQEGEDITLNILRVKCKNCKHTHALLLDSIVPYSQFPLIDQVDIVTSQDNKDALQEIMDRNCLIDESIISKIKFRYNKYYKNLILPFIKIIDIDSICENCFIIILRQFMQIKTTINWLYRANHLTLLHQTFIPL